MSKDHASRWSAQSSANGIWGSCALLTGSMLLFFPAFAWFGYTRHNSDGLIAAAVAGAVCWLGATLALVIARLLGGPQYGVHGILLGIMFRTGIPFLLGSALSHFNRPLAEAGLFGMVVVYYLLTLVIETLLVIRLINPVNKVSKAS